MTKLLTGSFQRICQFKELSSVSTTGHLRKPNVSDLSTCLCRRLQGTLQKFVDDVFVAILSTKRPPPIAVRFFFDFLDDMAEKHGIDDPETVHIWKTNR